MTISEYAKTEENFKNNVLGKIIGYGQCWDLVQEYVTKYLNIPDYVLAGCGLVSNLLYPPKINDLLDYFDEVPMTQMLKGDIVIWEVGHIAVFDDFDGQNCWYVTQNTGTAEKPEEPAYLGILYLGDAHAFRIKGIVSDPEPEPLPPLKPTDEELLEMVRKTIRGDYGNGDERIANLGEFYELVQTQVDLNIQNGLTNWDDIKLF